MLAQLKILLVEDNPGDVRLFQETLREIRGADFDLKAAGSLEEALELLSRSRFDICLLDLGLPDSEGLKGLTQTQAAAPTMPVIIRTSLDNEDLAVEAVRSGAQDYLVKGQFNPELLSRAMEYAIQRKQIDEELRHERDALVLARRYDETLTRVGAAVNATLEVDEVLERVVSEVSSLPDAGAVLVAMIEGDDWIISSSNQEGPFAALTRIPRRLVKPLERIILKGQPLVIEDVSREKRTVRRLAKEFDSVSLLAVPLRRKGKPVGALALTYRDRRQFGQSQINFMTNLANLVSQALENARLYQTEQETRAAVQSYAVQLSVLHKIGLSLNRETDLQRLQELLLHSAADLTAAGFTIMTVVNDGLVKTAGIYQASWQKEGLPQLAEAVPLWHRDLGDLVSDRSRYAFRLPDARKYRSLAAIANLGRELLVGVIRDSRGRVKGMIILGNKSGGARFTGEDEDIISLLATQGSVAMISAENFEKEHAVAETLQSSLLPEPPVQTRFDVGLLYRSASNVGRIGGDFYDFIPLEGDVIALVVGDVCGKGLGAANHTAMVKYMLRAYLAEEQDPGACLTRLNRALAGNLPAEKFITVSLALIDLRGGTISYSLAGHPAPLVSRRNEIAQLTCDETLPLGVLPDYRFSTSIKHVWDATAILMFTDGFIETRSPDGEQFGYGRLQTAFASRVSLPAQRLAQSLLDRLLEFSKGELTDDVAVVVIKPAGLRRQDGEPVSNRWASAHPQASG